MKLNFPKAICGVVLALIALACLTTVHGPIPDHKPGEEFGWTPVLEVIGGSVLLVLMGYAAGRSVKAAPAQETAESLVPVPSTDPWLRETDATDEELAKARAESVEAMKADGREPTEFTCDKCDLRRRCTLAFDSYNTDGDCLLSK